MISIYGLSGRLEVSIGCSPDPGRDPSRNNLSQKMIPNKNHRR